MGDSLAPGACGGSLREVAMMFAELGEQLTGSPDSVFDALTRVAVRRIDGAESASITTYSDGTFATVAATDDRARRADAIQYELRSGPCVDAIVDETLYHPRDLGTDPRWPEYGRRVSGELGLASMLSYRLSVNPAVADVIAGLNVYSYRVDAFDDASLQVGLLLATHGSMALAAQLSSVRARHLERALQTSRDIGVAVGVLMAQHKLTREQAFDLLRIVSQNTNRKINDVALEVAETGALPRRDRHPSGDPGR
ncbi:MAG TPA: GAF and ANTAR domain-containing protein [Pseudonocardia sp.]|jgi:hypothetical protein